MTKTDWKELLGSLDHGSNENNPENIDNEKVVRSETAKNSIDKQDLIIRFEKRNGKPATIISNFSGTKSEIKDLAKSLKTFCGSGGSAKDDEILIQGDVRSKIAQYLKEKGYKIRGDIR